MIRGVRFVIQRAFFQMESRFRFYDDDRSRVQQLLHGTIANAIPSI